MQIRIAEHQAQGRDKDPKDSKIQMHPSRCLLLEVEINWTKCLMEELWIQDLLQHRRMILYPRVQIAQANKWKIKHHQRTDRDSRFQLLYPVKNKRTQTSSLSKYRLCSSVKTLLHWTQRQFSLRTMSQPRQVRRSAASSSLMLPILIKVSSETIMKIGFQLFWTSWNPRIRPILTSIGPRSASSVSLMAMVAQHVRTISETTCIILLFKTNNFLRIQ